MSTPANRKLMSPLQMDINLLQAFPLPVLIFDMNNTVVAQSNSFFKFEANLPVTSLLKQNKYNFFSNNDIVILTHRLKSENKITTQRVESIDAHLRIFEIYLSVIPGNSLVLMFFTETLKPVNDTQDVFLKEIVQDISEGIGLLNEDNIVTFCNKSFAQLFGKNEKGVIGENILRISDRQNKPILENEIENQRALLESTFEIQAKTHDNKEKYILVHAIPRIDDEGRFAGSLFTTIDITDRVIIERELICAKDNALESDKLKSTFLANMSHEIRTPMNCIIGFSSMLLRDKLERKKQEQYLNIVISRGKHLMQILDDIIDITKIEENQVLLNIQSVNLYELFADLLVYGDSELFKANKQEVKLTVKHGLSEEKASIYSDSIRLYQILSNLMSNAIKFTDQGYIELGYFKEAADQLVFYIRDTGIGIPPNMHKTIFERFRQVDESFTRSYGGTGLGLTICQGLVQLLGGRIWVESDGINGSTFYFTLPYYYLSNAGKPIYTKTLHLKYNWEGRRLLIIEDDPSSYEFLFEALSENKCEIKYASNGVAALEIFARFPFDIILLDIQLPEIDGLQIARQIRKMNPRIPIIAQTAHAMSDDRLKCIEAGCNEYITKPIQIEVLNDTIDGYFQK